MLATSAILQLTINLHPLWVSQVVGGAWNNGLRYLLIKFIDFLVNEQNNDNDSNKKKKLYLFLILSINNRIIIMVIINIITIIIIIKFAIAIHGRKKPFSRGIGGE